MTLSLRTLCVVSLASLGLSAQGSPDFSGTWTMDLARSEAAAQGAAIGPVTVSIRQTAGEVRVETTRDGSSQVVRYLSAGAGAAAAEESVGTFRWEGPRLVTTLSTHINKQAVTLTEVRRLNPAGTEMIVDVTFVVQHGYQSGGSSAVRSPNSPNSSTGTNVFLKAR